MFGLDIFARIMGHDLLARVVERGREGREVAFFDTSPLRFTSDVSLPTRRNLNYPPLPSDKFEALRN